ncbi:signal transduction histidine kinase [Roseobacter cerasinus]|uniref:Signal transduction histidine kinase n=1 Tax=Roseobacter cerasinus TaxID=2602289 RepID=A0A640VZ36_9RHOB|nr:PAS domain-containing protein [Roseobacter cerasinus]GFE51516.1 signal transduction histidine kinase [Roseobacter cerasinus]
MADTIQKGLIEDTSFDGFGRTQVSMVVTNPHLKDNPIVYVNHAFTRQTGYARSAAIGRNCRFLQGEETDKAAVDLIRRGIEARESISTDILNYRANGEPFLNRLVIAPICDEDGEVQYFVGVQKELRQEERGRAPEQINAQLTEIQDRVETDMSMIISMIRQQSNLTSVPEEYAALSRRIETLQLLYEEMKLSDHQSNRDHIQMGSYLSRLCCAIGHVYGRSGIRMNVQIDPLDVPIETASRVGLVVSEILTNAFIHAFERIDTGLVEVRMSQLSAGGLRLTVSDDGVGIPATMSWPNPSTVGGRIVNGLIEGLEGTLQLGRGAAGSFVTIDVPAGASITE